MIKNIFSRMKTVLRTKYEIFKYARILHRKSDGELQECVNHECGLRAWCSQRSYYLAALRKECEIRGLDYIQ